MAIEVTPTLIDDNFDPIEVAEESLDSLIPEPIGTDIAFDFESGEVVLGTTGTQVQVVRGNRTVAQWIMSALSTEKGRMSMYPAWFGSGIVDAIAGGTLEESVIAREISDTVVTHDRIRGVTEVTVERDPVYREVVYASFIAVMDNGDRIRFGRVPIG